MIISLKTHSLLILFVFHFFGIVLFAYNPQNAQLSFLTVGICALLILLHEKSGLSKLVYITIILFGYIIEVIGVNTTYLFGSYTYGTSLGVKFLNVPPLIGLNWLIIIISGASIARILLKKRPVWQIAIISAFICTFLDLIIEPVAIKFNFWQWENGRIPVYNYLCWIIFSFIFSFIYLREKVNVNKIGVYTYGVWIAFFSLLNFI